MKGVLHMKHIKIAAGMAGSFDYGNVCANTVPSLDKARSPHRARRLA